MGEPNYRQIFAIKRSNEARIRELCADEIVQKVEQEKEKMKKEGKE